MKLNTFFEQNGIPYDLSIYFTPYVMLTITILCSMSLIIIFTFLSHKFYVRERGDKPYFNQFDILSFFKIFISIKEKLGINHEEITLLDDKSIFENSEHLSTTTTTDSKTSMVTTSTSSFKTTIEPEFDPLTSSISSRKYTNVRTDLIFYKKNLISLIKDSFYTKVRIPFILLQSIVFH